MAVAAAAAAVSSSIHENHNNDDIMEHHDLQTMVMDVKKESEKSIENCVVLSF
jgi:hypothetical protein